MAEYVLGKNEVLAVWDGVDTYDPVVCLTSHSINESVDEITAPRTKCDTNNAIITAPGDYSYEITMEGVYAKSEASKWSWVELRDLLRGLETHDWRITTTYADASTDIEYGTGWFSSLEKTAENNEYITFSATLRGSGEVTSTDPNV